MNMNPEKQLVDRGVFFVGYFYPNDKYHILETKPSHAVDVVYLESITLTINE